ncbi:MAG: O-antigen ligase family protein [Nitrospira sp.]|nr:O-antigen ligase family protein [Nitrospira sp.]
MGTIGLVLAYVAFLASGQAIDRFRQVLNRPSSHWAIAFLGIVLTGVLYASVPWSERWIDVFKWRTIFWMFLTLAIFDEARWRDRLLATFLIGTVVGVAGSFAAATGLVTLWRGPADLLRNYGTQGMAFACAALICAWTVLEQKSLGLAPWVWLILGVFFVTNIVFITDSRSAYVVLGLGLSLLLSWRASWKHRVLILVGLFVAAGLAFAVSPKVQGKMSKAITEWTHESDLESHTGFGARRVFYANTLEIIGEHWVFGVGTGGFPQAYREHIAGKYPPEDWRAEPTGDSHNQYLAVFVEHGIVGILVFIGWLFALGFDRDGPQAYRGLAVAILAGWCVTSLFSSHFRTFAEGHLLATFLGVLLAVPRSTAEGLEKGKVIGDAGRAR